MNESCLSPSELGSLLGLPAGLGYFEIFNFYFSSRSITDAEIKQVLMQAFVEDSPYCFCVKISNTFCWFTLEDKKLNIKGSLQFSNTQTLYNLGMFIKQLRYKIVSTGINLKKVKFLLWDADDIKYFENYIVSYDLLSDFFKRIDGCESLNYQGIIKLLQKKDNISYNAITFVECLRDNYLDLGLYEKDGILYGRAIYKKDYVNYVSSFVDSKECSYGIILDVEGVKESNGDLKNGISELGGIIYCRQGTNLIIIDTFISDKYLATEALEQAIRIVKQYKPGYIRTYVYGTSDEVMLKYSIDKSVYKQLKFINIQKEIAECFDVGYVKQSEVANQLGVFIHKPKHNALADAKTLFNILSKYNNEFSERSLL